MRATTEFRSLCSCCSGGRRAGEERDPSAAFLVTIARVLQWTTSLLLFGHGALAAVTGKALFAKHYATLGWPGTVVPIIGYAEMIVSVIVMVLPNPALLIVIAVWKIATESLFPLSGSPIWEFIERGGSYAAPLALAVLTMGRQTTPNTVEGDSR